MTQAVAIDYPNETLPVRTERLMQCQRIINTISPLSPEIFVKVQKLMAAYDLDGIKQLAEEVKQAQ